MPPRSRRLRSGRLLSWLLSLAAVAPQAPDPASAASQVCTSRSAFAWSAVADPNADWDCADADSPGADDHFEILHPVSVTGDIRQDGVTPGVGIAVRAGGELLVAGPHTLAVNRAGLVCDPGSVCRLHGVYRERAAAPGLVSQPDPLASFRAGDVVPCPDAAGESDCDDPALRARLRLVYPDARYGPGAAGDLPHICPALAAVDPGALPHSGDVVAFWNPDAGDLREGADTSFWYEVVGRSGSPPCSIDLDVRQGRQDQHGHPHSRRELALLRPGVSTLPGDRLVEFPPGSLEASGQHVARMLRFERAGRPEDESYRIARSRSGETAACRDGVGPCDILELARRDGVLRGQDVRDAGSDEVWIDYGWAPGDAFLVIAPVRVVAAEPGTAETPVRFEGTVSLRAVVIDATDTVIWEPELQESCLDLWLLDLHTGIRDKLHLKAGIDCRRLSATGGDPVAAADRSHTIVARTSAPVTLRDVGIRHNGDDGFSVLSGHTPTVILERMRVQFSSANAFSDECVDVGTGPIPTTLLDLECLAAARTGSVVRPRNDPSPLLDAFSVMAIATGGGLWLAAGSAAKPSFRDVTLIGLELDSPNHELLPLDSEGFVLRNSEHRDGRLLNGGGGYLRNGIVRDNQVAFGLALVAGDLELENVAILRTGSGGSAALWSVGSNPLGSWRRVLLMQEPGAPVFKRLMWLRSGLTDLSGLALEGLAFVHHTGPPASRALQNSSGLPLDDPLVGLDFQGPLCFFDNDADADPTSLPQLPATSLFAVDPQFVDESGGGIAAAPGSPWDLAGCGVRGGGEGPGVRAFSRVHAWSRLTPEFVGGACNDGLDNDGDGWADFPDDPGCAGPAWLVEDPECDDGLDNDGDGAVDWAGRFGNPPDPGCHGDAAQGREMPVGCGLGAELAPLAAVLLRFRFRRTRTRPCRISG